jgi:hypothetical protein
MQIKLMIKDYNIMLAEKGEASIRDIVRRRGIPWETLRDYISLYIAKSRELEV